MVREWIYNNISKPQYGNGDPEKVVLVGHSAGGLHIGTNLYAGGDPTNIAIGVVSDPLYPPIAGVVYLSAPFSLQVDLRRKVLSEYYETENVEKILSLTPAGLIEGIQEGSPLLDPKKLPSLIVLVQYDPYVQSFFSM